MTDTATAETDEVKRGTILTDAADPEDKKPWTIKGMPEWVLDIAKQAAKDRRMSMGEWLTEVIPMAARGNVRSDHGTPTATLVPAIVSPKPNPGQTDASHLTEIAAVAKQVSAIEGLPMSVLREAHGLLRDRLKAARRG